MGALVLVMAAACSDPARPERVPVVQLVQDTVSMAVGDTIRLGLLPVLPPGYVPKVTWSSSNPNTATVEKAGWSDAMVRALNPGTAVITVAGDGARDSVFVSVAEAGG